jgi:AcrR family transcriptional regulator
MSLTDNESSSQRRRGKTLEKALLNATMDELKAAGYTKLTLDGVALRAGTSKGVLYRRFGNRHELVVAALRSFHPSLPKPAPDTGSLRGDVLALFQNIYKYNDMDGLPVDIGLGLLTDTISNPQQHEYYLTRIKQASAEMLMPALQRAEERGEINTSAIPERLITLPLDLARHEIVMTGRPATKAALVQIVDEIYLPLLRSLA